MKTHWDEVADLKREIECGEAIAIIWKTEDVIDLGEDEEIELSHEEAVDILLRAKRNHSACSGITWDTLLVELLRYNEDRTHQQLLSAA